MVGEKASSYSGTQSNKLSHLTPKIIRTFCLHRPPKSPVCSLPYQKRFEDFDYAAQPAVDRRFIDQFVYHAYRAVKLLVAGQIHIQHSTQ